MPKSRSTSLTSISLALLVVSWSPVHAEGQEMWVNSERIEIHSCPSETCGKTGWDLHGSRVVILEQKDGWGRIDNPTPALCENGVTFLIDEGDNRCLPENGIVDGMLARWVDMNFLSGSKPEKAPDPEECDRGFLSSSDNYATYSNEFCAAARQLINGGECTEADFVESGGWAASSQYPQGTFFTYCGGIRIENKIYLDAKSGKIFR
ncbi:MAG: hypothetical protein V4551_16495 [Pseudomonadota bacterium]